jgi:effector-binding domain-containing protein
MDYEVRVEHADPRPMAAVRRRAGQDQLAQVIPDACGEVWRFIRANAIPNPGCHVAVYLDGEINIECGALVPDPFPEGGAVIRTATPGGLVATTTHFGPYNRLGDAHRAIVDECAARALRLAGPNWEIYDHWDDAWNDDPSKIRTDVFYLLEGDGQP